MNIAKIRNKARKAVFSFKEFLVVERPMRTMGMIFMVFITSTSVILAIAWYKNSGQIGITVRPIEKEEQKALYFRAIDGSTLTTPEASTINYTAVMIDNISEAFPQSGINAVPLIYEAPVEGVATRLMVVLPINGSNITKIGPVRSVRPYFIDWAKEYDAALVHVGGSPEALTKIQAWPKHDLDEFRYGSSFWRDTSRTRPHNVYTSTALLEKVLSDMGTKPFALQTWSYSDKPAETALADTTEKITPYEKLGFTWQYDMTKKAYTRYFNNRPMKTADGKSITAKNIIIMETTVTTIDNEGRKKIKTTGTGKVKLYRDGKLSSGTWQKESATSRTVFLDDAGEELPLARGTTWIEVVDNN